LDGIRPHGDEVPDLHLPARGRFDDPKRVRRCFTLTAAQRAGATAAQLVERQVRFVAIGPGQGQLAAGDGDIPRLERWGIVGHGFH
jgi:hypothetical protein